jgi:hypothetical protein
LTSEGFYYYIEGDHAVVAGYDGTDTHISFPDELDGYPVTVVDTGCLRGNTTVQYILLPLECTEIRAEAFANCTDLRRISCYSTISVDASAFTGCPRFRAVVRCYGDDTSGWPIPAGVKVYEVDQDMGIGGLSSVYVDDQNVIYGVNDESEAAILDIPGNITYLEVPEYCRDVFPVIWMSAGAMDHAASNLSVYMCPDMGFDLSLLNLAEWDCASVDDFCWNWYFTCVVLDGINADLTDRQLVPDRIGVEAAMIRARELEQHYDFNIRPDGTDTPDMLDGMGLEWTKATIWDGTIDTSNDEVYDQQFDQMFEDMIAEFSGTHSEGYYYDALGAALWYSETEPTIYVYGIGIIR